MNENIDIDMDVPDIKISANVVGMDFHPTEPVLALGRVDGKAYIYRYGHGLATNISKLKLHNGQISDVQFSRLGEVMYTVSTDRSLSAVATETGDVVWNVPIAHGKSMDGVNKVLVLDEHIVATGGYDGAVKIWDRRDSSVKSLGSFTSHQDYITGLVVKGGTLLASSADGRISSMYWPAGQLKGITDPIGEDDELLSMSMCLDGESIVCGTAQGYIEKFKWGKLNEEEESSRFFAECLSIEAAISITSDLVVIGGDNSILNLVSIADGNQGVIGPIAKHGDFPIESLAVNSANNIIVSASHDQIVKFWNISELTRAQLPSLGKSEGEGVMMDEDEGEGEGSGGGSASTQWMTMNIDEDEGEDEVEIRTSKKKEKQKKRKKKNVSRGSGGIGVDFFSGF